MRLNSVRIKIVSAIIAVLGLSIAVSIYITTANQKNNLLEATRRNLSVTNEVLNTVIRSIMLSGEAPIAVRTMEGLKSIQEFQEISIYRTDGTTAFNDYTTVDFVNNFQDKIKFPRTPRTEKRMNENSTFKDVLTTNTPRQIESPQEQKMEYFFPIMNYAECRVCHGDKPFVRGVAHYQVSTAGIYRQIGDAGVLLSEFFVFVGILIAAGIIYLTQRIILRPVFRIGGVVGEVGRGNLDASINIRSRDELGDLAGKINDMIDGLKTRNRLLVENKMIEARNQENRKYLDNIAEGLLLIDRDYKISEQYSAFLVSLFGRENPAGMSFLDFALPESAGGEERKDLEKFLGILFNNTQAEMEMILSINPLKGKRIRVPLPDGSTKEIIYDASFIRIFDGVRVENIMVIFEDRTQIVHAREELEAERQKSESEIEQIAVILKAGPAAFREFADDASRVLHMIELEIDDIDHAETVNRLFRDLHSLKGTARYLEFRAFAAEIHMTEGIIADIRDGKRPPSESAKEEIRGMLSRLLGGIERIRLINERFQAFAGKPQRESGFFDSLKTMAEGIAKDLGKEAVFIVRDEAGDIPYLPELKNALIHLVRNSLDHGIEAPIERLGAGKQVAGAVGITTRKTENGGYLLILTDDGRGIDFPAVERKARERGLLKPEEGPVSKTRLVNFLFRPDFSSKTDVTDLSGRGVGLDVVSTAIKEIGGKISVESGKDVGTRITLQLPPARKKEL
jgi:HAMP domain-containing protein